MTPNDYQQAALRTAPGDLPPEKLLLNGLMGLNGEAGEAIDILKKHLFQGHELDTAHKARYPDGFDTEHSLHRNQDDI